MNKQKILLGLLLVGLVMALFNAFRGDPGPEPRRPSETAERGQRGTEKSRAPKGELDKYLVHLDLLDRGVEAFREPKRDLFQLSIKKPAPPPKQAPFQRPAPVVPRPVALPPAVPAPPPVRLSVLGYLQTEKDSKVFLSSGNNLFVVKKGTRFGSNQEFFVEDLTAEAVVVRQAERPAPIRLPLKTAAAETPRPGFSIPAASPFRGRPGGMPSRLPVPDEMMNDIMNDIGEDVPFEDDAPDTDEAGDEGPPGKEGFHE